MMTKNLFTLLTIVFSLMSCRIEAQKRTVAVNVPDWARDAIWYQIFPERFRNGDPNNDPRFQDTFGSWPHDTVSAWRLSPWTADWYQLQPWEAANGRGFYENAARRRYGGDLQGIIDKLDYLQELGVNALYLNPIFESPTLHKYDTERYQHVDNNFGPDPQKDRMRWSQETFHDPSTWPWTTADSLLLKLIREVHARNMHIILDGVFNHMGVTSPAFRDVMRNGQKSPYADWFVIQRWDDPMTPANEFAYQGWYGVMDLPEVREVGEDLAAGPKAYFQAILRRWMDPNDDGDPSDGIDGWRLDVAEMVPKGFWRDFRKWVRGINPQAYLTGEVWWEDFPRNKMFNAAPWLQGDMFDAVMNYRFAEAVLKYFVDTRDAYDSREFNAHLEKLRSDYPEDVNYVLMNLMDSHDTERLGSMVVNPNRWIDHASSVRYTPEFGVRKPNANEKKTQKLIVAFQILYLGAPMIYYGDEAGMWGADDPDCRKPMVWPDMPYDVEKSHPFGRPRPADSVYFDTGLFNHYKTFTAIRRNHRAIRRGSYRYAEVSQSPDVFAFIRSDDTESILSLFNRSVSSQEVRIPSSFLRGHAIHGKENLVVSKGNRWTLAGKSVVLLSARPD